jgi:hypothetical protein
MYMPHAHMTPRQIQTVFGDPYLLFKGNIQQYFIDKKIPTEYLYLKQKNVGVH